MNQKQDEQSAPDYSTVNFLRENITNSDLPENDSNQNYENDSVQNEENEELEIPAFLRKKM